MQQKPGIEPRTPSGSPAEVVPVPSIAETKGLVSDGAHMRMDPRVLSRISNVVSVLEQDYAQVLRSHIADMEKAYVEWKAGTNDKRHAIYELAHDIRGVAGTFGRPLSGQIATRICTAFDHAPDNIPAIEEHIDALSQVASLSPEPEGAFAQLVLRRLDDLQNDPTDDKRGG